jgi:hypothetical protein
MKIDDLREEIVLMLQKDAAAKARDQTIEKFSNDPDVRFSQ